MIEVSIEDHERYQKLVIEVEDPEAAVRLINRAAKAKTV